MKLATALTERSDLQRRIIELGNRLNHNAKVMEGDTPAEDPAELLKELDRDIARLQELIAKRYLQGYKPCPYLLLLSSSVLQFRHPFRQGLQMVESHTS